MDRLLQRIRYAISALARAPGFAAGVVLILALGIGATTAVFCAIDSVLLQPLPFPNADRLVRVTQVTKGTTEGNLSPGRLQDWARLGTSFEKLSGYYNEDVSDTTGDLPERVRRASVARDFVELWGISPTVGRGFAEAEYAAGGVVLISDRYWHSHFNGDASVLQRVVRLGDRALQVVGVMPASLTLLDREVDLWVPMTADPQRVPRQAPWYVGVGRLKEGVTPAQAQANLTAVQSQLARQYPQSDQDITPKVELLSEASTADVRTSLWFLFGAVCILLLIACTNIASLFLSRAAQREQEVAVCFALGASRITVAVQLLIEAILLSLIGGTLGVLVAAGIAKGFRLVAPGLPHLDQIVISWRVVIFAVLTAAVVAVLCGVFPAIRSARLATAVRSSGRTQVSSRQLLQWTLVGVQVTLSVALLAGAGLLLKSFAQLAQVTPGFDAHNVLTFQVSGGYFELANYDRMVQRINTTLDDLATLPRVQSAATTSLLPGVGVTNQTELRIVESSADRNSQIVAEYRVVAPDYFKTLSIPVLGGELCRRPASAATLRENPEAMVNRSFVQRYLGGRSPIGLHLAQNVPGAPALIVGVVADARETGIDRDPVPVAYGCFSAPNPTPWFVVRTSADPHALISAVRQKVKEREPLRSVYEVASLDERIDAAFAQNRLRTLLLVSFAVAATVLACLGVYGTLSYSIALRQREVGLLLALGAYRHQVITKFLRESLLAVGIACIAGLALTLGFSRLLSGMLFGVQPADPATLSIVVLVIIVVAISAAMVPAIRAAALDPMRTLREE